VVNGVKDKMVKAVAAMNAAAQDVSIDVEEAKRTFVRAAKQVVHSAQKARQESVHVNREIATHISDALEAFWPVSFRQGRFLHLQATGPLTDDEHRVRIPTSQHMDGLDESDDQLSTDDMHPSNDDSPGTDDEAEDAHNTDQAGALLEAAPDSAVATTALAQDMEQDTGRDAEALPGLGREIDIDMNEGEVDKDEM